MSTFHNWLGQLKGLRRRPTAFARLLPPERFTLSLEATSLGLVSVPIGAFDDDKLTKLLALPPGEEPLYLIAIGHPL